MNKWRDDMALTDKLLIYICLLLTVAALITLVERGLG